MEGILSVESSVSEGSPLFWNRIPRLSDAEECLRLLNGRKEIELLSAKDKEPFYEKFGFFRRPNDERGAGMSQFYTQIGNGDV